MFTATINTTALKTAVTGVAAVLTLGSVTQAASIQYIRYADYATDFLTPLQLDVVGVSQDASTIVGTIRMAPGNESDRAFYYRGGSLTTIEGLGGRTAGRGISADGKTMVSQAQNPEGGIQLIYSTNLGGPGQQHQFVTPSGYSSLSIGTSDYGYGTRGAPLSADGSTVVARQLTGANSTLNMMQVSWTASGGLQNFASLTGTGTNYNSALPTAVSSDGSVIVGKTTTAAGWYRWEAGGSPVAMRTGPNNSGGSLVTNAFAISADGDVVGVRGGLWRAAPVFAAQPFRSLPGYTTLAENDSALAVVSSDLLLQAMTPDANWAAGYASSAKFGWIWNAQTDTTYDITQFLLDHGVDLSGSASDPLKYVTGLALNGDTLTIVGNTFNQNGWVATVTVPEPAFAAAFFSAAFLIGRRRRV